MSKELKKIGVMLLALMTITLLMINLANAEVQSLGTFQKDSYVSLIQICDNCTFVNLTYVQFPNSRIDRIGALMTKDGSYYNYSYINTSQLGSYIANTCGDENGIYTCASYDFTITETGKVYSVPQSITYIIMLVLLILIFAFTLYNAITIQSNNKRNEFSEIIQLNGKKYLKYFLAGISYILFVWIIYIAWNVSYAFLEFDSLASMFKVLFTLAMIAGSLFIPFLFIFGVVTWVNEKKIQKMIDRGLPVQ